MANNRAKKLLRKSTVLQGEMLEELQALVKSIERAEILLTELKQDTEAMNARHQHRRTTREDIAYLEELLKCAKKKLAWEKQMASLQKRTPVILETMTRLMKDPQSVPAEGTRSEMLRALREIQSAMERLNQTKVS